MSINPFKKKGMPLEKQLRPWSELNIKPYNKDDIHPYARARIILMNGIVIAVLERRGEIGTMRALGATKQFVRRLFAAETLSVVTVASLAGLALGAAVSLLVARRGIALSNSALVSLFGGNVLRPRLGAPSVLAHFAGAVAAGSLAWVYPVRLALRIQPLDAMSGK